MLSSASMRKLGGSYLSMKHLRSTLHRYRLKSWLIEGEEKHSGQSLRLVYSGHEGNRNYLTHTIFADGFRHDYLGRLWAWRDVMAAGSAQAPGLIIAETDVSHFRRVGAPGDFFIPFWIKGEIELGRCQLQMRHNSSVRDDLRKIRKQGYECEVSRRKRDFEFFYHEMYHPYISRVHADRALFVAYEHIMARCDSTDILFIKQGDQYVAGGLMLNEKGRMRFWALGVKNGDYRHVKEGAMAAVYYHIYHYLAERGHTQYDAGVSRAFLTDGTLRYKRKWGMALTRARRRGFWLRRLGSTAGVRAFLEHNPFVHYSEAGLTGVAFLEGDAMHAQGLERIRKAYGIDGLEDMQVLPLP